MRIHSDILTENDIREALVKAQSDGRTGTTVGIAVLSAHGSRKRNKAFEVQLGSSSCKSFVSAYTEGLYDDSALKRSSRRHVRQNPAQGDPLRYAPTWHEWGHFLAQLFHVDPNMTTSVYADLESFEYQTGWDRDYRTINHAESWSGRAYDFMSDVI